MKNHVSLLEAIDIIRSGKPFSATFTKRTTDESRHIVAIKKKPKKEGKKVYDFRSKNLIPVYDLQKEEYRTIPVDGLALVNGMRVV